MLDRSPRTILPISASHSAPSVYFFPDIAGNVLYAKKIIANLQGLSVYGLKLDHEQIVQLPQFSLQEIAQRFAADLYESDSSKPFHLIGHSFAGLLTHETACQLIGLGARIGVVAILDSMIPRELYSSYFFYRAELAARALKHRRLDWLKLSLMGRPLDTSESTFGAWMSWVDVSNHPASYQLVIEQMIKARIRYKPSSYPGDITLFKGSNFRRNLLSPRYLGWEYYVNGKINLFHVKCNHLDMVHSDPAAQQVAKELMRLITESEAAYSASKN